VGPPGLIVLAAGGSKRMGEPKQLLAWKGRTLLRHACETALATKCRPVVIVLGREAEAGKAELAGLDVIAVVNGVWEQGMGTSVAAGVRALESEAPEIPGALFMLVDQPGVTAPFLDRLVARWAPPNPAIVATQYGEGGGVPAVIDRAFFGELRALESDHGARALIAREKSWVTLVASDEELADLDTPEIYRKALDRM
jgi:molybdenum cofactor cytidylyltransferase